MATEIPVIDISGFMDGSDPRGVAKKVDATCREIGFFVVTGHGFDLRLLEDLRRVGLDFFRLPMEKKRAGSEGTPMGYLGLRDTQLAHSRGDETPPDLHEGFFMARPEKDLSDPYFTHPVAAALFSDNAFPPEPAELQDLTVAYYWAMSALCRKVMRLFALALDLPEDHFEAMVDKHFSFLRLVYYPALTEAPLPGQLRAGAHSDYGTFTLVNFNDAPGGLQVLGRDGAWVDVPVVSDSFVCNIGDLFEVWTNDRWVSTKHRVALPSMEHAADAERLTLVYFHQPNWDTVASALPTCVSKDNPPKYEPITAGEHNLRKLMLSLAPASASPSPPEPDSPG